MTLHPLGATLAPAAFAALATLAGLSACAERHEPAPQVARASLQAPTRPDAAARRPASADARIVSVLLRELRGEPALVGGSGGRAHITAACDDGILTLQGEVGDQLAKQRAIALAGVVRGVRAILDEIQVVSRPREDYELEFAVASALARDPVTAGQPIAARARGQVLRLGGSVDSNAARRAAESDVLAVAGVRDVIDELVARPPLVGAGVRNDDARLAHEAERMVRDDSWLDGARVRATAAGGVVKLVGSVGSWTERARAEADARETSPVNVDMNGLRVEAHDDDGTLRSSPPVAGGASTDAELASALTEALFRDARLRGFLPEIDVRGGMVALTGIAPATDVARAAAEDARNVLGVLAVHDDLNVPTREARDRTVLYETRSALERDPGLGGQHFTVDVWHGRIFLRGSVASETQRLRAISVASSIPGAQSVEDALFVLAPTLLRQAGR